MQIDFKEKTTLNSQQTIVKFLRERKYCFKPITEYDNSMFYCIIKCEYHNAFFDMLHDLFGWAGVKQRITYVDCPLSLSVCEGYSNSAIEPIIFTQEDIIKILKDVPENYVGETEL